MEGTREISKEKYEEILSSKSYIGYAPKGLFYLRDGPIFIGVDNSTGEMWTEEFRKLETCVSWLNRDFEVSSLKRDTNEDMMQATHDLLVKSGLYGKAENIMDYFLPESYEVRNLTNYEFDFRAVVNFGGSEGIYVDCYIHGIFDDTGKTKDLPCGTYKTLREDREAMMIMGELSGALTYYNHVYVNQELNRYTPSKEYVVQHKRSEAWMQKKIKAAQACKDFVAALQSEGGHSVNLDMNHFADTIGQQTNIPPSKVLPFLKLAEERYRPEESQGILNRLQAAREQANSENLQNKTQVTEKMEPER